MRTGRNPPLPGQRPRFRTRTCISRRRRSSSSRRRSRASSRPTSSDPERRKPGSRTSSTSSSPVRGARWRATTDRDRGPKERRSRGISRRSRRRRSTARRFRRWMPPACSACKSPLRNCKFHSRTKSFRSSRLESSRSRHCRGRSSSICCSRTRSRASSPTRSTAATATRSHGSSWAFPASPPRTASTSSGTACPTTPNQYRSRTCTATRSRPTSTAIRSTRSGRGSREAAARATGLNPVDDVVVGVAVTGTILAKELAESGLSVVSIERGPMRDTCPDFQMPNAHADLKYQRRHDLMQDLSRETITFRNNLSETALPMRYLGSFKPGEGVGGAGVHWGTQTWRFLSWDFETRSRTLERYGKHQIVEDCTSKDWGVIYDALEPHFTKFEYLYGVSGKVGNLDNKIIPGGNPFEGRRSREYLLLPMKMTHAGALFTKAAESLGYKPFPTPVATPSAVYTNPYGVTLNACVYCGYCEGFACEVAAKASPQTTVLPVLMKNKNFELRTLANVTGVNLDTAKKRALGVVYVDSRGREFEQPAELVLLCSYVLNNVRLMLQSRIGKPYDPVAHIGVVGQIG